MKNKRIILIKNWKLYQRGHAKLISSKFFMLNWNLARDGINDDVVSTDNISVMIEEVNWIPNERQLLLVVWMQQLNGCQMANSQKKYSQNSRNVYS